jgi:hypothetical protein
MAILKKFLFYFPTSFSVCSLGMVARLGLLEPLRVGSLDQQDLNKITHGTCSASFISVLSLPSGFFAMNKPSTSLTYKRG